MRSQGLVVSSRHPFQRVPRWLWIASVAAVTAWSAWYLTTNYRKAVALRVADAKAWTLAGPPCPRITEAQFLGVHRKGPRRFEFEGVAFYRRYGHVQCAAIRDRGGLGGRRYPVCQFTSPGDLMIRTDRADWFFSPGPGQPATITLADGSPRCLMASTYTLKQPGER